MSEETKDEVVPETESNDVGTETEVTETAETPATDATAVAQTPYKGFWAKVDNFFGISKSGSKFRVEVVAGLTTFMAMVYILMVNAGMFELAIINQHPTSADPYGAAYIATAIGAIVGTMLMAFLAKMPLAQASGMGVNAFIVYTLVLGGTGLTYANCMVFTLLDGVIFLVLTATGLRQKIFEAIPEGVRHAIPVGIGLFIAFIGMQNAGIIVNNDSTLVTFVSFNVLANGWTWGAVIAPLVALIGVLAIAILSKLNVKGSILWGILGSAALYYIFAGLGCIWNDAACVAVFKGIGESFSFNPFNAFASWGKDSVGVVFYEGFNYRNVIRCMRKGQPR